MALMSIISVPPLVPFVTLSTRREVGQCVPVSLVELDLGLDLSNSSNYCSSLCHTPLSLVHSFFDVRHSLVDEIAPSLDQ